MRNLLFISYSRADMVETDWLGRLNMYLAPLRRADAVEIWDDSRIETAANWRVEIDKALESAVAAILIVGPGFLASDFVMEHELPRLLELAKQKGIKIIPVIVGYCGYKETQLENYQAANDPDAPLESLRPPEQNKILNELATSVDRILRASPTTAAAQDTSASPAQRDAVREIARKLDDTWTAFVAQCRLRDELVSMIEKRLRIRNDLQYEKFFFKHFQGLTKEERFQFDQIRAMTEGVLCNGNRRILELLEEYPDLLDEIPGLMDLRQHLVFWLNKFDRVFMGNKAMCLLYAGVEDGVPFPSYVADQVQKWLDNG